MNTDMVVCLAITVVAITWNYSTCARALWTAVLVDDCPWVCSFGTKRFALKILLGFGAVCFILASLKLWSIQDVFISRWSDMGQEYHWRAFAYLGENIGVAWLGWTTTTYIKLISRCDGNGGK